MLLRSTTLSHTFSCFLLLCSFLHCFTGLSLFSALYILCFPLLSTPNLTAQRRLQPCQHPNQTSIHHVLNHHIDILVSLRGLLIYQRLILTNYQPAQICSQEIIWAILPRQSALHVRTPPFPARPMRQRKHIPNRIYPCRLDQIAVGPSKSRNYQRPLVRRCRSLPMQSVSVSLNLLRLHRIVR